LFLVPGSKFLVSGISFAELIPTVFGS